MSMNNPGQPLVTRTMRAAVKVGEDYYTIEETISLQPGATEAQISEAVQTGMQMYVAQWAMLQNQIAELRSRPAAAPAPVQMRDPDAPASEKQRSYMEYLLKELGWSNEQLVAFATERQRNLLTLTKREASELIDELKRGLDGGRDYAAEGATMYAAYAGTDANTQRIEQRDAERNIGFSQPIDPDGEDEADPLGFNQEPAQRPQIPIGERATQRQVRALERLVDERGIDLEGQLRARFGGRVLADLSMDEAGQLLSEWQQLPRVYRPQQQAARRAS